MSRPAAIAARTTEISAAAAGVPVKRRHRPRRGCARPRLADPAAVRPRVWVVHIDRHIGLELFSPQDAGKQRAVHPRLHRQETPEPGIFDGITATSQVGPYRARIADVLGNAVEQTFPRHAAERLLRTLNLISGRWGLEMLRTTDNVLARAAGDSARSPGTRAGRGAARRPIESLTLVDRARRAPARHRRRGPAAEAGLGSQGGDEGRRLGRPADPDGPARAGPAPAHGPHRRSQVPLCGRRER